MRSICPCSKLSLYFLYFILRIAHLFLPWRFPLHAFSVIFIFEWTWVSIVHTFLTLLVIVQLIYYCLDHRVRANSAVEELVVRVAYDFLIISAGYDLNGWDWGWDFPCWSWRLHFVVVWVGTFCSWAILEDCMILHVSLLLSSQTRSFSAIQSLFLIIHITIISLLLWFLIWKFIIVHVTAAWIPVLWFFW